MSSPIQMTSGSRSISSNSPWRMASRYVVSAIVGSPAGRTLVGVHRRPQTLAIPERGCPGLIGIDTVQRITRLRCRRRFRLVGGLVDLGSHPRVDLLELLGRNTLSAGQLLDVAVHRIVLPGPTVDLTR